MDAGEDRGGRARRAVEDFDVHDGGALGGAVGFAPDGAGAVRAVAVGVLRGAGWVGGVGDAVYAEAGAAFEFGVCEPDAGVKDVGGCAGTGGGVVDVLCSIGGFVGEVA